MNTILRKIKLMPILTMGLLFAVINSVFALKWINFQTLKLWFFDEFLFKNNGYNETINELGLSKVDPRKLTISIISMVILLIIISLTPFLIKNKKRQIIYLVINIFLSLFLYLSWYVIVQSANCCASID